MPTKLDDLYDRLGLTIPGAIDRLIHREATFHALARCAFRLITTTSPDVSHDPFLRYHKFTFTEHTEKTGTVSLEMLIQPSGLMKLPHVADDTDPDGDIDIHVDNFQLFALAFDCIINHVYCDMPAVNEDAQTSGPAVIFTDDVYLSINVPGVQ